MNLAYVRITHGQAFKACETYWAKVQDADERVNALAIEFHCVPGCKLRCGSCLEGLLAINRLAIPAGWRAAGKSHPGFIKPNNRTLAGREAQAKLDAVKLPTDEDLANLLGFPPFFTALGGGRYCSSASCFMRGGVYYLELPSALYRHLVKDGCTVTPKDGIELIKEWEYLKAEDQK